MVHYQQIIPVTTNAQLVEQLADRLASAKPGDIITHDAIGSIVGCKGYLIGQARKQVAEINGAIFKSVRSVGLQRLDVNEAPTAYGAAVLRSTRARHRRAGKMIGLAVTKSNSISPKAVVEGYAMQTQIGLIEQLAHMRHVRAREIEVVAEHTGVMANAASDSLERLRTATGRTR